MTLEELPNNELLNLLRRILIEDQDDEYITEIESEILDRMKGGF